MPRKALTYDLASATVRFPRINADQTTSELTAALMRTALDVPKTGVQYLTANAVWDGSIIVTNDATTRTLSLAGHTGALVFVVTIGGNDVVITNSPGAILDGTLAGPGTWLCWVNATGDDGAPVQLA